MKKISILAILFFTSLNLFAQDDLLDIVAKETCECTDSMGITKETMQAQLGMCMLSSLTKHPNLASKLDFSDKKVMRQFGESVGLKMADFCPNTILTIGYQALENEKAEMPPSVQEVEGTFKGFEGEDLTFIIIHNSKGRRYKLLWLTPFDGDGNLISLGKKAVNKPVSVQYKNEDFYSPKMEEYITRKVITQISFK